MYDSKSIHVRDTNNKRVKDYKMTKENETIDSNKHLKNENNIKNINESIDQDKENDTYVNPLSLKDQYFNSDAHMQD